MEGGINLCSRLSVTSIMLVIPLIAPLCPTFVLKELKKSGNEGRLKQEAKASTSMGSPTAVPVPWHFYAY